MTEELPEPGTVEALKRALTDEQIEQLRLGEELEFYMEDGSTDQTMQVIRLGWYTQGVIGDNELSEHYPDVIGFEP
jgi:hypothetical protein